MNFSEFKSEVEEKMSQSVGSFSEDLKKVRTGGAQVSMLDSVKVEYYGNLTPLNQVASISCPDPHSFLITPWEVSVLKAIEVGLVKSDLGMAPINNGKVIRLKLPDLTEERRQELVKKIKKMAEECRILIRKHRKESNDFIKKSLKEKIISEDESKSYQEEIQQITDKYISNLDQITSKKQKDLMTV